MRALGQIVWQTDARGDTRFSVVAANGNAIVVTGEGYVRPIDARRARILAAKILVDSLNESELGDVLGYRAALREGEAVVGDAPEGDGGETNVEPPEAP